MCSSLKGCIGIVLTTLVIHATALRGGAGAVESRLSTEATRELIDAIRGKLVEGYIYEDVAKKLAAALDESGGAGRYDAKTPAELAALLTDDLQRLSLDRHLRILADPPAAASSSAEPARRPESRDVSFGFVRLEILEGRVGYLDLRKFSGDAAALARADAAMALMADVEALIIDVGRNGGGTEAMVKHLSTYLFDQPTHLVSTFMRGMDKPRERWTLTEVPGKRLAKVPVYILTSRKTFSAAESFTFGLVANKRVTVVGERTGGGGHFGGIQPLVHGFSIWLPRGRTYDPKTDQGWEAAGIRPDVEVPYERALATALEHAKAGR